MANSTGPDQTALKSSLIGSALFDLDFMPQYFRSHSITKSPCLAIYNSINLPTLTIHTGLYTTGGL